MSSKVSKDSKKLPESNSRAAGKLLRLESYLGPLLITLISGYLRLYEIAEADRVIWDEAHFGKFGAYYLLHEFYFDVHPPLGKLLIGLSGKLAGFNGSYLFDSGNLYPAHVNYGSMRIFNAMFGIFCAPLSYYAAKSLGYYLWTVYLISFMVVFENSFVVLSKFILLDSMLLFFTSASFLCMLKFHQNRARAFSGPWLAWLFLTGISIGCVCSVKWVGLFVTATIGIYTVVDLFAKFADSSMTSKTYFKHWALRIINLILVPFIIYAMAFKVHFLVLYKTGTGHASMSSLFQANLVNTDIQASPRNIAYGSKVTIRSQGLSPNLLHSHVQQYPKGSRQHQVTTYGHKDANNEWVFAPSRVSGLNPRLVTSDYVQNGDRIRLYHHQLLVNLHSHQVAAHVSRDAYEVSGYGNDTIGDLKDDWIVEIVEQVADDEPELIHPLTTNFRLKHAEMGCFLGTTGSAYPAWGFKQGEVVCKNSFYRRDKSTWWNVEDHSHESLPVAEDYVFPKSSFWRDFILLNFAMHSSNNALVPDDDKFDNLASKWWEWPIVHTGLRMSSWGVQEKKYYLFPNPFVVWFTTANLFLILVIFAVKVYQWQLQAINYDDKQFNHFLTAAIVPFIGWLLHYLPFCVMARVTYVHHYLPAEYFAIFLAGFNLETLTKGLNRYLRATIYLVLYGLTIYTFQYFAPLTQGIEGQMHNQTHFQWFSSWDMI